jgi:hypothetical protein
MNGQMDITFTPRGMVVDCSGYKGRECQVETERLIKYMRDNGVDVKKKDVRIKGDMSANTNKAQALKN